MSLVSDMRFEPSLKVAENWGGAPMIVLGECLYAYRKQFEVEAVRRACERRGLRFQPECEDSGHRSHDQTRKEWVAVGSEQTYE